VNEHFQKQQTNNLVLHQLKLAQGLLLESFDEDPIQQQHHLFRQLQFNKVLHHDHQIQHHLRSLQLYDELELARTLFIFINLEYLVCLPDLRKQNIHEMLD
jgi:hypothetical protein